MTDANGRVVFLHGVNMVYKVRSYRPEDTGFGANDARFLRRNGFNTVRLGIILKGLEPRRPQGDEPAYREGYLDSIARTERVLASEGIYTLLDLHQDQYHEDFQGEGWPDWQVLDDGLPAEPKLGFGPNYFFMAALLRAFDHFWANDEVEGRGLQEAYADAWRLIARRFRDRPFVIGYDLFNEPWPGSAWPTCTNSEGCPLFDTEVLSVFSERVIKQIRRVDRHSLVFYEPLSTFNAGAKTHHEDTNDPDAGFSFHIYCIAARFPGLDEGACPVTEETSRDNADDVAERNGDVPFLTEFGATDDLERIERIVEGADEHMLSWQYWHYCDCEDPTTEGPGVQSLVLDPSDPPKGDNLKEEKLEVLARAFPQVVAGTPLSFDFDSDTAEFDLEYSTEGVHGKTFGKEADTQVVLPRRHYPDGYTVEVQGAKVESPPGARVLVLENCPGKHDVTLQVTPGSGPVQQSC